MSDPAEWTADDTSLAAYRKSGARRVGYEVFIVAITLLSLINAVFWVFFDDSALGQVGQAMDFLLAAILIGDFLLRLLTVPDRSAYLIRGWGWADLLGSLPIPGLRLFRVIRLVRSIRALRRLGYGETVGGLLRNLSSTSLLLVTFLLILLIEFGSVLVLQFERNTLGADIDTGGEAVWWAIVTMTTVGYGDYVPVTNPGRIIGVLIMGAGIALVSVLTGFIANAFLSRPPVHEEEGASQDDLRRELAEIRTALEDLRMAMISAPNDQNDPTEATEERKSDADA